MIYYSKDNVMVKDSCLDDAERLAPNLRKSDIVEIWASNHHEPLEALKKSLNSLYCMTIFIEDEPIAMFGIHTNELIGEQASIWLLASDRLNEMKMRFLRQSKKFIGFFLDKYPYLCNFVHSDNIDSILWLRFCGANIYDPQPYGLDKSMFRFFEFKRRLTHV